MNILRPAFTVLIFCGCWRPYSWRSSWKGYVYTGYTALLYLVIHTFTLSQMTEVVLNVRTADDFTDGIYMLLAAICACSKINMILFCRKTINAFMKELNVKPFKPMNMDETDIRRKFDKRLGSRIVQYVIMVEGTVACMILSSLYMDFGARKLAYRAWLPFDYSSTDVYVFAYAHQMLGLFICALSNVGCDCIVCGLLVHTCCQIEILQLRLKNTGPDNTTKNLRECISYHDCIYKYASLINEKFRVIVGIQFFISTLVVCVNLYQLANKPLSTKYIEFVMYMTCMMTQIFIYCWYGNQLKLKSLEVVDTIFDMSWCDFKIRHRKDLTMIVRRAMIPIEFTSAYVLNMDLKTFVAILKLSYSSFNLLQTSKQSQ